MARETHTTRLDFSDAEKAAFAAELAGVPLEVWRAGRNTANAFEAARDTMDVLMSAHFAKLARSLRAGWKVDPVGHAITVDLGGVTFTTDIIDDAEPGHSIICNSPTDSQIERAVLGRSMT